MGKVVKKVAKVAVPVALVASGFGFAGMGPFAGLAKYGAVAGQVAKYGGLAMQGYSSIQGQKYQKKQAGFQRQQVEEQNKANEARNRYNQLLQKASTNLGNINVAEDVGNQITALNTRAANFGSQANTAGSRGSMWKDMGSLGGSLFASSDKLFDT